MPTTYNIKTGKASKKPYKKGSKGGKK